MGRPAAKIGVAVFFAALLAFPLVHRYVLSSEAKEKAGMSRETALDRYGFYLEEVSQEAGIEFTHQAPVLDARLNHIMPQVASMGAAVSVVDFDRDGWQDLYVTTSRTGERNALYRNLGNGRFEDVAQQVGIADVNREGTGVSMGSVWGDYDNDGFEDLFLYKWGKSEIFHNDGGKAFSRVEQGTGLPEWANINSGLWFDYDRDGKLDLFFGGYFAEEHDLWHLEHTRIMPESFEYAQNGGRKYLLRGNGDGTFEDVTARMGIESRRWTMAVSAADLRGTGFPDLYAANDYSIDELWFNERGERFVSAGERTQIGSQPKSGMNVSFGDIANEGRLSVYVSNITEPGILVQGNNLWVPEPGATGDNLRFRNMATEMKVDQGGWSWGAQFGDLNNDGHADLFVTNGYVSADRRASYWYDFSKVAGGHEGIISDASLWPAMEGRSLAGYQLKKLWLNGGNWRFQQVAQAVGADETYDGRAVVLVDLWNRGVLDVVVAHQAGPLLVYKNTAAPGNEWVAFELEGSSSNRSAIGAQVEVYWNGQKQLQEVSGGTGFCSQNQRRLHFGLGPGANVEKVVIRWPSGERQTLTGIEKGVIHRLEEQA